MNKIFSIVLIAVLLIVTISLVSCKEEQPKLDCGHHAFIDEVVDSTCKDMGYVNHVCPDCGYSYKDNYSEPHHYVDTVVVPTCSKEGYTSRKCSDCGNTIRENITPIDSKNHVEFEYVETIDSTCTDYGYDIEKCVDCGYQHKVNYTAPAHTWSHADDEEWPLTTDNGVVCGDYGIRRRTCTVEGCDASEEKLDKNAPHIEDNTTVNLNGKLEYWCDCGSYKHTTDKYNDAIMFELKTAADGTKYYVVVGYKSGITADQKKAIMIPSTVNNIPVTEIAANAFMNYTDLETVRIAVTVTKIGAFAFSGCTGLKTINYDGTMAQWNSISKVDGWSYGAGVFTVVCSDGVITK